jgi:putative salt-induced outer membrane protein YdiY
MSTRLPWIVALLACAPPALAAEPTPSYEYKDLTKPPENKGPTQYKANVSLGMTWATGNSQSIGATGNGLFAVRRYNNEFTFSAAGAYLQTKVSSFGTGGPLDTEKVSAENWLLRARYDRYFLKSNTAFVSFQSSGDIPSGFEYRLEPQVGYARLFWQSQRQLFRGELGYDYTFERDVSGTDPRNREFHSGRLFLYYENKFTAYATFTEGLEMLEAFNNLDAFRLNSLTTLSSAIYKNIALKLNFKLMFQNDPPARPNNLVDPVTMMPFVPPPDQSHFEKVDTQFDVLLAVTFL